MKITPELMCDDVDKSIEFYMNVLGFEIVTKTQAEGKSIFALIRNKEASLMFYQRTVFENEIDKLKGIRIGGSFCLYLETENIDEVRKQIEGRAVVVKDLYKTEYGSYEMVIEDFNGYLLILAEN